MQQNKEILEDKLAQTAQTVGKKEGELRVLQQKIQEKETRIRKLNVDMAQYQFINEQYKQQQYDHNKIIHTYKNNLTILTTERDKLEEKIEEVTALNGTQKENLLHFQQLMQ